MDAETASDITSSELDESTVLLSELMKPGEEIRQVKLKSGQKVQYIAIPECATVLGCLKSERRRLQDIYWDDERIAEVMGIDLSGICNNSEDAHVTCKGRSRMLSDCRYCVKYGKCRDQEEAEQLKEEYAELAILEK